MDHLERQRAAIRRFVRLRAMTEIGVSVFFGSAMWVVCDAIGVRGGVVYGVLISFLITQARIVMDALFGWGPREETMLLALLEEAGRSDGA